MCDNILKHYVRYNYSLLPDEQRVVLAGDHRESSSDATYRYKCSNNNNIVERTVQQQKNVIKNQET